VARDDVEAHLRVPQLIPILGSIARTARKISHAEYAIHKFHVSRVDLLRPPRLRLHSLVPHGTRDRITALKCCDRCAEEPAIAQMRFHVSEKLYQVLFLDVLQHLPHTYDIKLGGSP